MGNSVSGPSPATTIDGEFARLGINKAKDRHFVYDKPGFLNGTVVFNFGADEIGEKPKIMGVLENGKFVAGVSYQQLKDGSILEGDYNHKGKLIKTQKLKPEDVAKYNFMFN